MTRNSNQTPDVLHWGAWTAGHETKTFIPYSITSQWKTYGYDVTYLVSEHRLGGQRS